MTLWTIQAVIFAKSTLLEWSNSNKNGSVINFDVRDESGEIRIITFNEYAKTMNSIFNVGDAIQLSKGLLKPQDKKWCKLNHSLSITISKYSVFEKLKSSILNLKFDLKFNTIDEILNMEIGRTVNLVAIAVLEKQTEQIFRNIDKKQLLKKEILLVDNT